MAFRVSLTLQEIPLKYECFYLRRRMVERTIRCGVTTRSSTSIFRFPWPRLRKEFPEKYESYVDLVPGEWTKVEDRSRATKLVYVHDAQATVLVVNDLKHGQSQGQIALWVGPGTLAHLQIADIQVKGIMTLSIARLR